jgi:hypothetical protein
MRKLLEVFARNPDARLLAGLFLLLLLLLLPAMAFIFERLSVIRPRPAVADPPTAAVPAHAFAQNVKLTLNCQYESVEEDKGQGLGPMEPTSGSFSAIVRMTGGDVAVIDATTAGCFDYEGYFTEQQVYGDSNAHCQGILRSKQRSLSTVSVASLIKLH